MIIVKTPLRISFAGGGSDIPQFYENFGGATLSTAIDKYVYVAVNERFEKDTVRLSYSKTEIVSHSNELEHTRVKACMQHLGLDKGIEIVTVADIPSKGTGLGSSSSFTVGLLKALYAYQGKTIGDRQLAEEACNIEINNLKEPIGKQDQYIASFGGLKFIEYLPDGKVVIRAVVCSNEVIRTIEDSLLLFYTGIQRSASNILLEQVNGYSSSQKNGVMKKMVQLAYELRADLERGHAESFGKVLHESWLLKKQLASGISNDQIETMYATALNAGAVGGKLLGAGGGGFLLLVVPKDSRKEVRAALKDFRELRVKLERGGSKIVYNDNGKFYDKE